MDQLTHTVRRSNWINIILHEYYGTAEPPVRCGESQLSGLTEPPRFVYEVTLPLLDPVHILLS